MSRPQYAELWASLDRELQSKGTTLELARRLVAETESTELHLGVRASDQFRLLFVRMPPSWNEDVSHFPRWSGMRVGVERGKERPEPRRFLVLQQGPNSPPEVFEALAADVCEAITFESKRDVLQVVMERLDRWKTFFTEQGTRGLGPQYQQGLYGELWFLREKLLPSMRPEEAVGSWTGSRHADHDFQFKGRAIEVKTSAAKQHQAFHVASEKQLDARGLESLFVFLITLGTVDGGGESLPAVIDSIRKLLEGNAVARRGFAEKLLESGYLDAHAEMYRTGYLLRSVKAFKVGPGFPRLLASDLPPGVGELSYSVVIAACEPFKFSIDEAIAGFTSDHVQDRAR